MIVFGVSAKVDADPRRPVVAIGVDERAVVNRAVAGLNERAVRGVEIRHPIVGLERRRDEVVAEAQVHRQLRRWFPVVLDIERMADIACWTSCEVRELRAET